MEQATCRMRGTQTLFILVIYIQSIILHPSLGQTDSSQDYLLDDRDYSLNASNQSDLIEDSSAYYYDGLFDQKDGPVDVSESDLYDYIVQTESDSFNEIKPENVPPTFLSGQNDLNSAVDEVNASKTSQSEPENPQVGVGSVDDLCHVYEGLSNIVLDIEESNGSVYTQSTSPRHTIYVVVLGG